MMATIIVKFSNGRIKKYHKGSPNKKGADLAIKEMIKKIRKYKLTNKYIGVIWDGKKRPWREENEEFSKMETKYFYH